jgi:hypothetical protein
MVEVPIRGMAAKVRQRSALFAHAHAERCKGRDLASGGRAS